MKFDSLEQFGDFLGTLKIEPKINEALEVIGQAVENTAKMEFGIYQPPVGAFPAWVQLSDVTKRDRLAQGYTENDPLLRSGKLRDSISHVVDSVALATPGRIEAKGEVIIGSEDPIMAYQELGTSRIPPRPVLGPAVLHNIPLIKQVAGLALAQGILPQGSSPLGSNLKALYKVNVP